jgi:endonuclease/exonuclease/phosphatase (EEP) superfamily protein YafD
MSRPTKVADFFSVRLSFWDLLTAAGAVMALSTIFGFLGRFWWLFDLFSHFRVQYFIGLLAAAVLLGLKRESTPFLCFSAFAAVNFFTIAPFYVGKTLEPNISSPGSGLENPARIGVNSTVHPRLYRSLLLNVNTETGDPVKVATLIYEAQPEIMVLEELSSRWVTALSAAVTNYPYSKVVPREDNFGIGLFCKYPFTTCEARQIGEADVNRCRSTAGRCASNHHRDPPSATRG